MKRFRFYALLIALVTFVACSDDDFNSQLTTDLETETLIFSAEGGQQSFLLESNESWMVSETPDWLRVEVKDADDDPATRSEVFTKGKKEVTLTAEENSESEERTTELTMKTLNGKELKLKVIQEKKPELSGYWILSEGTSGQGNSELAWYDVAKDEVAKKHFKAINGKPLGDTANELALYGSKMYVVVTGAGFDTGTTADNSYIEVINPIDGKSIKRISFTDAEGTPAKPRNIIFEGGKGYITSYSNEVVRLDTASLTLDNHAALSGILAEGLTYNNGNLYVCNGGHGQDNKISVVDVENMEETKVITTANNPNKIESVSNNDIYFTTDWPEYKLYKLTISDETITEIPGLSVADITYSNNSIFTSFSEWGASAGALYQLDIDTEKATKFNLDYGSVNIPAMTEYHIGKINGSDHLYVTGTEEEIVVFDPATKEIKHAFYTGTSGGSGVVAVYR
ncbi:MAG: BACON domain-containing protein [Dysgonamonadaceae bacterium]|nr:BACON domain-containing protein [Dysgonamonadaceae bacterium]